MDVNCNGPTFGSAKVAVFPIPPTPAITQYGNELYASSCCGNQWYKNRILLPGATSQTINPVESGHYFDIVTLNSCVSDTSNDIYFVVEGTDNQFGGRMIIKPNPARESIQILLDPQLKQPVTFDFYSTTGQRVKHILPGSVIAEDGFRIDISELSPGFYLILIQSEEICTTKKLIVK
jgi:hypothetical protein